MVGRRQRREGDGGEGGGACVRRGDGGGGGWWRRPWSTVGRGRRGRRRAERWRCRGRRRRRRRRRRRGRRWRGRRRRAAARVSSPSTPHGKVRVVLELHGVPAKRQDAHAIRQARAELSLHDSKGLVRPSHTRCSSSRIVSVDASCLTSGSRCKSSVAERSTDPRSACGRGGARRRSLGRRGRRPPPRDASVRNFGGASTSSRLTSTAPASQGLQPPKSLLPKSLLFWEFGTQLGCPPRSRATGEKRGLCVPPLFCLFFLL